MVPFAISLVVATSILGVAEIVRRKFKFDNEIWRKLVHVIHGALVAYWPFVIGYDLVIVLEVLFIFAVFAVHELHWFPWLWRVGRRSWGQYAFPIGVIIAALVADSPWIFLAAVLELGLADAAAALIGKKFGHSSTYKMLGQKKSIVGSLAFFAVSVLILIGVIVYSPLDPVRATAITAMWLSVLLTATENLGVYGSDNLFIPVVTVVVLNSVS